MLKSVYKTLFLLIVGSLSDWRLADELLHFTQNIKKPLACRIVKEYKQFYVVDTLFGKNLVINKKLIKKKEKIKGVFDLYEEKKNQVGLSDTVGLIKVADWCLSQELRDLAVLHYGEAIKSDPKNKDAPKKLEKLKKGIEDDAKKAEEYRLKTQDAFVLRLTYNYDISEALLERDKEAIKESNRYLYQMTEGFAYLKSVTIELGLDNGDYRVRHDPKNSELEGNKGVTSGSVVYIEENFHAITFVHELGHLKYGVPDEYIPKTTKPCSSCLVAATVFAEEPEAQYDPDKHYLPMICDEYIHDGEGTPCWENLRRKKYKHLGFFFGKDYGSPPEVEIKIIRDAGKKK
ncbi:MAG: hypothetical protein AABZ60_05115 [Planctomycetota bacterium]